MRMDHFIPRAIGTMVLLSVPCALGAQGPSGQQANSGQAKTTAEMPPPADVEQRLGPFLIAGQNYTVVLHRRHLGQSGDVPAVDGVVSTEIVDAAGTVLNQRSFPLWADEELHAAWSVLAGTLSGTNGRGLVVKFAVDVDTAEPDPDANAWWYSQVFGVVDGKFVAFGGPVGGILMKPGADGEYRIARTPGSQSDELPFLMCNGHFCFDGRVRIDWGQGKVTLAPQCAPVAPGGATGMCQYQLRDPKAYLRRSKKVTFLRLYSSPDEKPGRPERIVVRPDSKIDFLTVDADVEMKQVNASTAPFVGDQMRFQFVPNTEAWLQVRVDGKEGWVHGDKDLAAIGLPEPEDQ